MNNAMDAKTRDRMFEVIKASLWEKGSASADWAVYREMRQQSIQGLPAGILASVEMPDELRQEWKAEVYRMISTNVQYRREQAAIPITVPYAILKGTSAARYYPHPLYRTMGDIDLMTRKEDFDRACAELLEHGYKENTGVYTERTGRHREFEKNGVEIEAHVVYTYTDDPEKAKLLDGLILSSMTPEHELPDEVNGLVLLNHINLHMEEGIGLRQILDWMLFVHHCLPDEKWPEFRELARQTGMEEMAVAFTRMCEIYLGLEEHSWSAQAEPELCAQLMDYVLTSGNFGRKQDESSRVSRNFLGSARTLGGAVRYLQSRGLITWTAAQRHRFLRPFAWIYQAFRYLKKGLKRKDSLEKLKEERRAAEERNRLFDALHVTREDQGVIRYRNGEYVKEIGNHTANRTG